MHLMYHHSSIREYSVHIIEAPYWISSVATNQSYRIIAYLLHGGVHRPLVDLQV